MEFNNLDNLDSFNLAGFTLNIEEQESLRASMILKRDEEAFSNIAFWGKLLAVQEDYFIAQATNEDMFKRKYFYTQDLATWFQLPQVTREDLEIMEKVQGKLIGDPAADHDVPKESIVISPSLTKLASGIEEFNVKEDLRIAGIVELINRDVAIVPRKMYYRDAAFQICLNPEFKGLTPEEIGSESSYLHFRPGYSLSSRTLAERLDNFDDSIDIFEAISRDQPMGSWSIQTEKSGSVALLRSLIWPGYSFTHTRFPLKSSGVYYGYGLKNSDIGFKL